MNELPEVIEPPTAETAEKAPAVPARSPARWGTLLALPLAIGLAIGVHGLVSKEEQPVETHSYFVFLGIFLGLAVAATVLQAFWSGLRRWVSHMGPILSGATVLLIVWEVITAGLRLLPMPYFPTPAGIWQSLINDRNMIADSTWHSLRLLLGGYAFGVLLGLITGVCIGWFEKARYWGMPVLKVIGPIPATAWIPLAMVLAPKNAASSAAMSLIALAVWFPVTMLTASGISNTRASFLDVAKTLGASRSYLIFRVAIPAAMPNIFIGLFMGLSASFLTLVVAETVGVNSGLGWYMQWAQSNSEYGKLYGALVVMSAFFSTIMTLLFKVRDRVLVWQKGTIKW